MRWWQWALMIWLAAGPFGLLVLAVITWWKDHALDREWKRFNRQRDRTHREMKLIR